MPLFQKQERLYLKKDIANLFEKGEKWTCFPFRIILAVSLGEIAKMPPASVLVSVSKRNFKNATDRNRLKRQIKEAYRLRKETFHKHFTDLSSETKNSMLHIGFIYTSKVKEPWAIIDKKMERALKEVLEKFKAKTKTTDA